MVAAGVLYAAIVVVYTWPMAVHFQGALVGANDAFQHLWGLWWFERALVQRASFWSCPLLLHPYGADLIQHDWPLWPNIFAFIARRLGLTLVGSYNAGVWLAFWLNAVAVFLLARAILKEWFPAFVGGLVFTSAPYFWARSLGHFGKLQAYPLAFLALCLIKTYETRSRWWALGTGGALTLAVWSEYYYAVHAALLTVLFLLYHTFSLHVQREKRGTPSSRWQVAFGILGGVAGGLAVAVALTGGGQFFFSDLRVSARRPTNLMTLCWMSWLIVLLLRYRLSVVLTKKPDGPLSHGRIRVWGYAALPLILVVPIVTRAAMLIRAGDFASQWHSLRSGIQGAPALAVFMPNVYHALWGDALDRALTSWNLRGLDYGSVALGWTALAIVLLTRTLKESSWWRFAFASFFLLSLGPFLQIAPGLGYSPVLPFWLVAYLPVVSGARVPVRWIAPALVAWSVLVAMGCQRIRSPQWRALALIGVLFEGVAVPLPMSSPAVPEMYRTIAADPRPGAVLELPFGVRDGRWSWGYAFPAERLYYQTVHQRPLVGGYLGRVPDRIFREYQEQPILQELVAIQTKNLALPVDPHAFFRWAEGWKIAWVVVDTNGASPALVAAIVRLLGRPVVEGGTPLVWKVARGG